MQPHKMLKKLKGNFKKIRTLINKSFNNSSSSSSSSKRYKFSSSPSPPPLSPPPLEMSSPSQPFWQSPPPVAALFPQTESSVLPDPSNFFAPHLLSSPLPTNSFFQNFTVKNGDQIRKIANLYNEKLRYQQEKRNRCLDIPFFTESNIQHSINLLGGIQ